MNITSPTTWPIGTAGNGTIWYQSSYPADGYYTFGNIKNPITVTVSYGNGVSNYQANICLNSNEENYPISGSNLEIVCPTGALGTAFNETADSNIPGLQKKNLAYSSLSSKFLNTKLMMEAMENVEGNETLPGSIYVKPSSGASAAFIVTIDSDDAVDFIVTFSGVQCLDPTLYPVGSNGDCVTIPLYDPSISVNSIPSNAWFYYQYTVNSNSNINSLVATINNTNDVTLYAQQGYYPTAEWYFNEFDDDNDVQTITISTPGYFNQFPETFFFGIYNGNSDAQSINFTLTTTSCNSTTFGYNCQHSNAITNDTSTGYYVLNATLSSQNSTNANNGTALSFDYDDGDYEGDYAYFTLDNYPDLSSYPYYIRVTVSNNKVSDDDGAPGFYAKRGGYPSAESNNYNVSTIGDVTHQIIIQITENDYNNQNPIPDNERWYFAVKLPSDFSIWAGVNCANECGDYEYGTCYCGNSLCNSTTYAAYQRPTSTEDSAGACECNDDDYDKSFDCSVRDNPYLWLWITLIAIAAVIILVIAVGVPVYCYIQQRRNRSSYDKM